MAKQLSPESLKTQALKSQAEDRRCAGKGVSGEQINVMMGLMLLT